MWGNRSFSGKKTCSKSRLNATLPAFVTSPISTRQRHPVGLNQSLQTSVLSAAGPPLSSPFMPQIKRALGLEPEQKRTFCGIQRRHSFNTTGLQSSSGLPHVVLNKSRQFPLTDRNSSMLKRSSTVRIAPPTPGKISSPSLYQMRNSTLNQDDRSTPDTHAVVSALKERRKRSIAAYEENHEVPIQHAKRRRQESQQSNASTSSMPSMPDNLPDLTHRDYATRIETPNINRPSRPSQEEVHSTWEPDTSINTSINRLRQDTRNNSILSSLSSSKRFAISQRNKRVFETSQIEPDMSMKSQRRDPPKLSHFNSPLNTSVPTTGSTCVSNGLTTKPHANGHTENNLTLENSSEKKLETEQIVAKPATLKQLPSLKKKASVYSALSQNSSFRKAQYANVIACLEDYDSDREAEHRRVQQMLNDVDSSFTEKEQVTSKDSKANKTATTTSLTASCVTTTLPTLTASVSIAVTSTSELASVAGGASGVTSQAVPKSPIQEVGDSKVVSAANTTPLVGASSQNLSSLLTQSKPTQVTSSSVLSALSRDSSSSAGNFSFGTNVASANSGKTSVTEVVSSAVLPTAGGFNFGGMTAASSSPLSTGLTVGSSMPSNSLGSSNSSTVNTQVEKTTAGGFNFGGISGGSLPLTSAINTAVGLALSSGVTQTTTSKVTPSLQTSTAGFGFGVSVPSSTNFSSIGTAPATQQGFSFGNTAAPTLTTSQPASAPLSTSTGGFTFGVSATSAAPVSGFGLSSKPVGTSAAITSAPGSFSIVGARSTPAPTTSGFSFGTSPPTSSTQGGFTFNATSTSTGPSQPAGELSFTPATASATPVGGFSFNAGLTASTTASQGAGGFSFGGVQASTGPPTAFGGANSTAKTAGGFSGFTQQTASQPAVGGFAFGTGSTSSTTSASGLKFGTSTTSANSMLSFGGSASTGANSTSPFTFNAGKTPSAPSSTTPFTFIAGATKTTASATPFAFNAGKGAGTTAAPTSFGQTANASSGTASTFQFGASNPSSSGFAFGTANQTPAFGSTPTQAPAFGSTTNQAPAFGSTTNQAPAFGTTTNQAPAFGTTTNQAQAFGSSTNQAPAFGSSTNQAPAFGSSTKQVPTFGSSTNQTPAFGTTNQSSVFGNTTAQLPAFGAPTFGATTQNQQASSSVFGIPAATQQSGPSVFGTSTNNSNSSVFGNGTGTATGFGKSHSMPSFGSNTPSNTGASTFEGQTAPNVNPFGPGPTTPAKQTGSAFGSLNTFGSTNAGAKKGFDFSTSAGGAGTAPSTGGFNFAAAASSTPVFNFGASAATPNAGFGTPAGQASFSVGTGDANRPQRPIAKGRRRVQRR